METKAHHVLIGLFTIVVVAAALLFALWLAKSSTDSQYSEYEVIFNEAVDGLTQGGAVQYNGIKVGDITRLALDQKDPRKVLATIRVNGGTPVKQDTHAKLVLTGVTGLAVIQLSGGSPSSPALTSPNGDMPVIVADPSPLNRLLANGEDLMLNVNDVVARTHQLLSPENIDHISHTLEHIDQATAALNDERSDLRQLVQQLTEASKQANTTLAQASTLMQHTDGLVNTQGRATLDSAQRAMASLEHSTSTLDQLLSDNRAALDGGMQGLSQLGPAVRELRDAAGSLQDISRHLDDNPAGYLLGRDRSKEFVP